MLRRAVAYADRVFQLKHWWKRVRDSRRQPQIPTEVFPAMLFVMFLCRLRSFHELEQYRGLVAWRHWLDPAKRRRMPCADEIAYVSERIDLGALRDVSAHLYSRLMRNKVLERVRGWRVAAVDGHETASSYKRCCEECLTRTIEVKGGTSRIQYYHRIVVLQLLGESFRLLLDAELVKKGEDEVGAAKRMIERVVHRFPRSFDILTGDALYAQAPVLRLLRGHDKHAVMVLKDEHRDLLVDAEALFRQQRPHIVQNGQTTFQQWDLEGFTSWTGLDHPVRVVRSSESTPVRQRVGNQWIASVQLHNCTWVTTLSQKQVPTASVIRFGHARWQIENQGFNEIVNDWHADHSFHHHPNSIVAVWLILFIAHAVFHCFVTRNLKPQLRQDRTVIFWARQIAASFRLDYWWPPPI
jgi:hypothetical protein